MENGFDKQFFDREIGELVASEDNDYEDDDNAEDLAETLSSMSEDEF